MKTKRWFGILAMPLLLVCLVGAKPEDKKTDIQTWTSLTGHQIVAEFVEIKGENLVLKDQDGVERVIRLPMLTSADQARAKELEDKRDQGVAQKKGASSNRIPIFTAGPGKGSHAIYKHKNFTATVNANGIISVQCLEDGKAVGKPLRINVVYEFHRHGKYFTRPITAFEKYPEPTLSPTLLEYEVSVKEGPTSGFNYEFVDNTIQMWGWVIDPREVKEPTTIRLGVYFSPSHTFPPEMLVTEQKKVLEPYTLVVNEMKKGVMRFPYGNAVFRLPHTAREMSVEGPIFGKRKVSVSIKSKSKTWLDIYNYRDYAPYQGYHAFLRRDQQSSKSDNERMILTID